MKLFIGKLMEFRSKALLELEHERDLILVVVGSIWSRGETLTGFWTLLSESRDFKYPRVAVSRASHVDNRYIMPFRILVS